MTPEEKIKKFFHMQSLEEGDREVLDQIAVDDVTIDDEPVGVVTEGKEAVWAGMSVPAEAKQGPDTFSHAAGFIDYVGDENIGYARWWFQPTGKLGFLWGKGEVELSAEQSPKLTISARVEFKDGKIAKITEYWNPSPYLQALGFDLPSPGLPEA